MNTGRARAEAPISADRSCRPTSVERLALVYVAFPTLVFVATWIVFPINLVGAALVVASLFAITRQPRADGRPLDALLVLVVAIAALWVFCGGVGHWVYANKDWIVRDAVLRDLVVERWPVHYLVDGVDTIMRAPIGYFLPPALIGRVFGLAAAGIALFVWTTLGVALVFTIMLRDRPRLGVALVRLAVFIVFSGMDVIGQRAHYNPVELGGHLEWWAFLFQYSSQTTQLFWVPNHALPGWIAVAWFVSQDDRSSVSTTMAILFVLFAPLWSPLTAVGIAPLATVVIVRQLIRGGLRQTLVGLFDWRMLVVLVVCSGLVFPYLVAGGDQVASGSSAAMRWVGEDFVPRYIEFLVFECAGFVVLLLWRNPRDALVWMAALVLAALPFYRFGPFNDLAMRGSIASLTLLAIRMGEWLSTRTVWKEDGVARLVAVALLAVGAVTPFMEFARAFIKPAWPLDARSSLVDVTRGTHYLTDGDRPWIKRFLKAPETP